MPLANSLPQPHLPIPQQRKTDHRVVVEWIGIILDQTVGRRDDFDPPLSGSTDPTGRNRVFFGHGSDWHGCFSGDQADIVDLFMSVYFGYWLNSFLSGSIVSSTSSSHR